MHLRMAAYRINAFDARYAPHLARGRLFAQLLCLFSQLPHFVAPRLYQPPQNAPGPFMDEGGEAPEEDACADGEGRRRT